MCSILYIDERKNTTDHASSWPGVKAFLQEKSKVMNKFVEESKLGSSLDKLSSSAVKEVAVCVRRQMD